jgi:hypothetical protein
VLKLFQRCNITQDLSIKQIFMQENSLIKQNILRYLDYKGVTQYRFYKENNVTRGILTQNNGITEDNLLKFVAFAQDISLEWLLTGNGSMLKTPTASEPPCNPVVTPLEDGEKGSMLDTINTQAHIIKDLTAKIATLESRLGQNEA